MKNYWMSEANYAKKERQALGGRSRYARYAQKQAARQDRRNAKAEIRATLND